MNMFLIDCADLNNKLCQECEDLIDRILARAADQVFTESAPNISTRVKLIQEQFATKADSSKRLVSLEKQLEDVKLNQRVTLVNDYNDLIEWLMMIYDNPRVRVQDEQIKSILNAYGQTQKISQILENAETSLKNQRVEIENTLMREKKEFIEMLEEIKQECDKFKDCDNKKMDNDYNKSIANINQRLGSLTDDMTKINEQEADLEFNITEFPLIDECKIQIKPYEDLWALVREFNQKHSNWSHGELLKLDPEEVEKDHKQMLSSASKLANRFSLNKLHKPEKIANDVKKDLMKFRDYLPIIRSLCNPGLKQRHWD